MDQLEQKQVDGAGYRATLFQFTHGKNAVS